MTKRTNIIKIGVLVMCFLQTFSTFAQIASTRSDEVERAQAKLMVVPYTKTGEEVKSILDDNPYIRSAMSMVKQSFDQRGWTTVDFVASLRAAESNRAFQMDRQADFKADLIAGSGADIYVEVDTQLTTDDSGSASVTLVLQAFEAHSGASFSNQSENSGRFNTQDYDKLIEKAYDRIREEFLNMLLTKTDEIREIGRAIKIELNLHEDAELDFDAEVGDGDFLNEAIEEWIYTNAYKGRANLSGITEKSMAFDEVRIPLFDQESGRPYNPKRFASELIKFLRSNEVSASRNVKGQNLFITIK